MPEHVINLRQDARLIRLAFPKLVGELTENRPRRFRQRSGVIDPNGQQQRMIVPAVAGG
jgi:hypothetical protein